MIPLLAGASRAIGGGGGVTIPFEYDANTYWWSYILPGSIIETSGDDSFAFVPERIGGVKNLYNSTKDFQPLDVVNGADYQTSSTRQLFSEDFTGIVNGTTGFYLALNCKCDTGNNTLLNIVTPLGTVVNTYVTSARNFALKYLGTFVGYGPAITLGSWYTLEMEWTRNPNTLRVWHNGTLQTLSNGPTGSFTSNFAAEDATNFVFGTFNGEVQQAVFYNGVPNSTIRSSISSYLVGEKP